METIAEYNQHCWRTRLRKCMEEHGLTQLEFVRQLNEQYLTHFHQKDVSRWLNTGNRSTNGVIGFPKFETMTLIADFFHVDVGYLTGESDETTFDMSKACAYTGLDAPSITAIRDWVNNAHNDSKDDDLREYRKLTLTRMFSSEQFAPLAAKMMTLLEMSTISKDNPQRFSSLMQSLATESDLPEDLTFQLILGAFYGMASESFSALMRDAYPTPTKP